MLVSHLLLTTCILVCSTTVFIWLLILPQGWLHHRDISVLRYQPITSIFAYQLNPAIQRKAWHAFVSAILQVPLDVSEYKEAVMIDNAYAISSMQDLEDAYQLNTYRQQMIVRPKSPFHIYVQSAPHNVERRVQIAHRLVDVHGFHNDTDITFCMDWDKTRFLDHRQYTERFTHVEEGKEPDYGQFNLLDHVGILKRVMKRTDNAIGIVFEDDAVMIPRFTSILSWLIDDVMITRPNSPSFTFFSGCLNLHRGQHQSNRSIQMHADTIFPRVVFRQETRCMSGYAVTRQGAQMLVRGLRDLAQDNPTSFWGIDHASNRVFAALNMNIFHAEPPISFESSKTLSV